MSKFRIYTTVQNFFLLVDKDVVGDPEVTPTNQGDGSSAFSQGQMWHNYPRPTTYMLGIQIGL
jgi:TonB-dependent starch-binding outer membrane protein SusC